MNFNPRVLLAIIITVVLMEILSSVIYAAGTFTTNSCQVWWGTDSSEHCVFLDHYFSYYNLSTNPFIDPLSLIGRFENISNPGQYPFP